MHTHFTFTCSHAHTHTQVLDSYNWCMAMAILELELKAQVFWYHASSGVLVFHSECVFLNILNFICWIETTTIRKWNIIPDIHCKLRAHTISIIFEQNKKKKKIPVVVAFRQIYKLWCSCLSRCAHLCWDVRVSACVRTPAYICKLDFVVIYFSCFFTPFHILDGIEL